MEYLVKVLADRNQENKDCRPGIGIGTMTAMDTGSVNRAGQYERFAIDHIPSVIKEMSEEDEAKLTHCGIIMLVKLPIERPSRLHLRALSRYSETYFTN